jgi:hypothetical protein
MTKEEVIRLILSFLGGGLVAGLLDWFRAYLSEKRRSEIDYLQKQLRSLYGPLRFFISQNQLITELAGNYGKVFTTLYAPKKSTDPQSVDEASKMTFALVQKYVSKIKENNEKIMRILEEHSMLADPDDAEIFAKFQLNYIRMRTEVTDNNFLTIPEDVYERLGSFIYFPPELPERVATKCEAKQDRIAQLMKLRQKPDNRVGWLKPTLLL